MRQSKESSGGRLGNVGGWVVSNWRSLTVLSAIFLIALMLRVFFAYGTSAGSGYALSGGSDAAYHLHIITEILTKGGHVITDTAINYPFGGPNYSPPLFDWSIAILAYPLTLFGYSTADAASIALVYATAIIGALTCIPVYKLGKEMFSRKAGYIAAAFFAISSLAIVKTVFSNGTESAYFVFFFVLMSLFLLRAVKAFRMPSEGKTTDSILSPFRDKAVLRNMIFASLSLIALELSWIGFLSVIMIISFIMVVQTVIDRLRGQSALGYVSIYGSVMLFALLIGAVYYALIMGLTMIILGPLCLALLFIIVSLIIAYHRVWVITIPVSIAIIAIVFTITAFFIPSLHTAMTSSFYPYAEGKFGALLSASTGVTFSAQAIYAGVVTMWFSFIVAAYMIIRIPKKADSPSHLFIAMWFAALIFASWRNIDLAYLAAPMYAIGTGVVVMWVLRRTNIKGYVESFKGTTVKTFWRKMIKPIPFVTVLATIFILLLPNVLYAVDASIPNNEKADRDAEMYDALGGIAAGSASVNYLGATNYYIKDNEWSLSTAWDHYASVPNKPALVTWLDYGAEAVGQGNFSVVADHFGNGYEAASNILLGTSSEAIASMTVRMMDSRSAVDHAVADAAVAAELKQIMFDGRVTVSPGKTASNTDYVRSNPDIFGPVDYSISGENAKYLVAANYILGALTDGKIAEIYNKACENAGSEIGYIGVTGTMLPVYYGDSSLFSTIAYLNDYYLDRNGAPTKYYTAGIPWTGYYFTYKDAMYDTMIWKALVGMSLNDYRALTNDTGLSASTLINGLMLSDGTYKAYPGFGLANFSVDLSEEWWVMYSPSSEAPYENWELMNGLEAQALQEKQGGTINYLGGMSFLKYDGGSVLLEGRVTTPAPAEGVGGMTVAIFDADGNIIGTTLTNDEGRYSFMVSSLSDVSEIGLYSGSVYAMEVYRGAAAPTDITIDMAEFNGKLVSGTAPLLTEVDGVEIDIKGTTSGKEYSFLSGPAPAGVFSQDVVPDIYTVTMTLNGASVYTGTFTLYPGDMNVGDINITSVTARITVTDRYSARIPNAEVDIIDFDGTVVASAFTDDNGVAEAYVSPGYYTVQLSGYVYDSETYMFVPNTSNSISTSSNTTYTTSFKATLGSTASLTVIMVEAAEVIVSGVAAGDIITLTNGAFSQRGTYTATVVADANPQSVYVPTGDYGDASKYTAKIERADGEDTLTSYAEVVVGLVNTATMPTPLSGGVSIEVRSDGEPVSASVSFINADGAIMTATVGESGDCTVNLPVGKYTVYAYMYASSTKDLKAFVGTINVTATTPTYSIDLVDASHVYGTISYSSIPIVFVPVIITATIDGEECTILASTDSKGNYSAVLPKSVTYTVDTEKFFGWFMKGSNYTVTPTADTQSRSITNIIPKNIYGEPLKSAKTLNPKIDTVVTVDDILTYDVKAESKQTTTTGRATITLTNDSDMPVYVMLRSAGLTFGTSSTSPKDEWISGVIAADGGTTSVTVVYDTSYTGTIEIFVFSGTMHVDVINVSGSTIELNGKTDPAEFYLVPGTRYELNIEPISVSGDYFKSGTGSNRVQIYAGQDKIDASKLVKDMTIVDFDVEEGDKVKMTSTGAVDSTPDDLNKIYYVPTSDMDTCTLIVERGTEIAYIDLSSSGVSPTVNDYMGEKASISGYAGRVASGEMTITMTAGTMTGTCIVPIAAGEYKADLPKTMNGTAISYKFDAVLTDTVNGEVREFYVTRTVSAVNDKGIVNMEVEIDEISPVVAGFVIDGNISDGSGGIYNVKVTYEIDGTEGSTTTNALGDFRITVPSGSDVEITNVEKANYILDALVVLPLSWLSVSADITQNFSMDPSVVITQTGAAFTTTPGSNMVEAVFTMDVTNNSDTTVVLTAGKGWSTPAFGSANYAVVIPDGLTYSITMTAYYNSEKEGAGSDNLSVIVKDLTGTVLQTKTLDTSAIGLGPLDDDHLEVTTEGNRVSKNEYGFAVTFTALTDKYLELELSIDGFSSPGWYASIVDSNNVKLASNGDPAVNVQVNGNSSVTYYVRLISVDDPPASLPAEDIYLEYGTSGEKKQLNMITTDLNVSELSVSGNNIFGSLNGMPTIVWAMVALAVLMVLLILWLGIRRGVFTRKR